ncbi:MAG: NAD(P)/FAD-dependent oxidoreductase [Pseudomonadota bacterium]
MGSITHQGRRGFLKSAGTVAAVAPWLPALASPSDPDVVIVGAGAAGLAAARTLAHLGKSFVVLEAADRIGGRAYTDTSTFGVPYDPGAHWLHNGNRNPFNAYARQRGFDLYLPNSDLALYVGDQPAGAADWLQFTASLNQTSFAIEEAGQAGLDVSIDSIAPQVNSWDPTTEFLLAQVSGAQFEDLSTQEAVSFAGGRDWLCAQGYGAVLADYGASIPVELQRSVERIDWSGTGVEVHTSDGLIRAGAVLVTVSTNVLASGAIEFTPALPVDLEEAISRIGMSAYIRVGLKFSENIFGTGPDSFAYYKTDTGNAVSILANQGGGPVSTADLGGDNARAMAQASDEAIIDYALGELEAIYGSSVRDRLIKAHVANWEQYPLAQGAWSQVQPGFYSARQAFREQAAIGDRVFFAGEALHPDMFATVAGAAITGRYAALQIANVRAGGRFEPLPSTPSEGASRILSTAKERLRGSVQAPSGRR